MTLRGARNRGSAASNAVPSRGVDNSDEDDLDGDGDAEAEAPHHRLARAFDSLAVGQHSAAIASGVAVAFVVVHFVICLFFGSHPAWFRRPRAGLMGASEILAAHPLEFPALLWSSAGAAGACAAARRVNRMGRHRGLYAALAVSGVGALLDNTVVSQLTLFNLNCMPATRTLAGFLSYLAPVANVGLLIASWGVGTVAFSEACLGIRGMFAHGLPGMPGKTAQGRSKGQLGRVYTAAVLLCILELFRSPFWRACRLLVIVAALEELRRASSRPLLLSQPEAAKLNRAVGMWAVAALAEAVFVGGVFSAWSRRFGSVGIQAAGLGLATTVATALPAGVALLATLLGWVRSIAAVAKKSGQRRPRRRLQLGRYSRDELVKRYMWAVASHYKDSWQGESAPVKVRPDWKISDFEYARLQVRLQTIGATDVFEIRREEVKQYVMGDVAEESPQDEESEAPATYNMPEGKDAENADCPCVKSSEAGDSSGEGMTSAKEGTDD